MDGVELVVDALAAARLTRLAVADKITEPVRDRWIEAAYTAAGRAEQHRRDADQFGWSDVVACDPNPPRLAYLATCPWCAGVWISAAVVAVRRAAPRAWTPVAAALAVAELGSARAAREAE